MDATLGCVYHPGVMLCLNLISVISTSAKMIQVLHVMEERQEPVGQIISNHVEGIVNVSSTIAATW